jgi:hypothetical protein
VPLVARGISDAFRDVELLAGAVLADEAGRGPLAATLRGYQRARDAAGADVARLAARVAALDTPGDVLARGFLTLAAAERDAADLANR